MDRIQEYINKLKLITPKVQENAILDIVKKHEAQLVDRNIAQMMEGKNSDNSDITPEYSPRTVYFKRLNGQIFDRVTLRDEGTFHQKMEADTSNFPVEINSSDLKTPKLVEKYGDKIFGLNKDNKESFSEEDIKADVQAYYAEALSL